MRVRHWIAACLTAVACEHGGPTEPRVLVHLVGVAPSRLAMVVGTPASITVEAWDAHGHTIISGFTSSWTSSDVTVATVSQAGLVTPVGKGSANISVTVDGQTAVAVVSVRNPVSNLSVSAASLTMVTGETRTVQLLASDLEGTTITGLSPVWTSSAPNVVSVTGSGQSGTVVGRGTGSAVVTATVEGKQAFANVTIAAPVDLAGTWDWVEQMTDPFTNDVCTDTGTYVFVQSTSALSGTVDQVHSCIRTSVRTSDSRSANISPGLAGSGNLVFAVTYNGVTCAYAGTISANLQGISGTVSCGNARGTWDAQRSPSIVSVSVSSNTPIDTLLRGTQALLSVSLTNSSGRRAFRRGLNWVSSNTSVARIISTTAFGANLQAIDRGAAVVSVSVGGVGGSYPIAVRTLTLLSVASGSFESCGTLADAQIFCWTGMPSRRFAGPPIASLALGTNQGCGLATDGTAYCWNELNQTVDAGASVPRLPTDLRFTAISVGGYSDFYYYYYYSYLYLHSCGITADGSAYCWGDNTYGQLGAGAADSTALPLAVAGGLHFSNISAGGIHTCGVEASGRVYCWGANASGQLGNGTSHDSSVPVLVSSPAQFASVYAGSSHTCALTISGVAWCWGWGTSGELGVNVGLQSAGPVAVSGNLTFTSLALGAAHTCGLTASGDVYCWGADYASQLGTATFQGNSSAPRHIAGSLVFRSISAGAQADFTCGLASDQRVYCWGSSGYLGAGGIGQRGPVAVLGQQ